MHSTPVYRVWAPRYGHSILTFLFLRDFKGAPASIAAQHRGETHFFSLRLKALDLTHILAYYTPGQQVLGPRYCPFAV